MNIFFTGAIRGGRVQQPQYADIVSMLKQYGHVLSEHVAKDALSQYGETNLTKEEIHDREMKRLKESDVVVAEVTTPSLGVGYLIAQAVTLGKRVVCLYEGTDTYKLSAMIKGDENVEVYTYENLEDLSAQCQKIFV